MAVAPLLAFPGSASAHIYNEEMSSFSNIREHAEGSNQWQNNEVIRREVDRVLKIVLHKLCQITHERKESMASSRLASSTCDVDVNIIEVSMCNDQSEVRDVVAYDGEGDGGHRCPYFPCPDCHRTRSILVPESKTCEEDEVDHQESTPLLVGSNVANDIIIQLILFNRSVDEKSVPVSTVTCDDGEGDGGHRCPYFPCPDCHRSRSIFIPETDHCNVVGCLSFDCKTSNVGTISHAHVVDYSKSRINDQSRAVPDKGHTCPCFPCPICHRTSR